MAASASVACSEITRFLSERKLSCDVGDTLKYNDVALLIRNIYKLGSSGGDEALHLTTIRVQVKAYAASQLGASMEDSHCQMAALRDIINHFCDLNITPKHMSDVSAELRKLGLVARSSSKKRRVLDESAIVAISPSASAASGVVVPRQEQNMLERLRKYQDHNSNELKLQLLRAEDAIDAKSEQVQSLQIRLWKAERKAESLGTQLVLLKDDHDDLVASVRFRNGIGKHVCTVGGYTLALKKTLGLASLATTAAMVAGDAHQGSVQDPHTVSQFEHRLSVAKALRHMEMHSELTPTDLQFFECAFDASQQEAVDKEKVHVSMFTTTAVSRDSINLVTSSQGILNVDDFSSEVRTMKTSGDLQVVNDSSGHETYNLVKAELRSVGAPSWEECARRALEAGEDNAPTVFLFGTDAGPDNIGMARRVKTALLRCDAVMFVWSFCLLHRAQLIAKAQIKVLDNWTWTNAHSGEVPSTAYFNGVSCVANQWRASGSPGKIKRAASTEWSESVAAHYFSKIPGRCLRNRWLAIDSVERIICQAAAYIGRVFGSLWGYYCDDLNPETCAPIADDRDAVPQPAEILASSTGVAVTQKKTKRQDPGQEEEDEFVKKQRATKTLATKLTQNKVFHGMVLISSVTRQPLVHFQLWLENALKEHLCVSERAKKNGSTYVGPTPLSHLAFTKRVEIRGEIAQLFTREHTDFQAAWELLPRNLHNDGRKLIASLLLVLLASWDFRFEKALDEMPILILRMVEHRHNAPAEIRKVIASRLLDTDEGELERQCLFTDLPRKLRAVYSNELRVARETGCCPPSLYAFLLLYRARLPYQSQTVEGHISVMQNLSKRGVRSKLPGVSNRLRNKIGDPISAKEAVDLHPQVLQFMQSSEYAEKWVPNAGRVPQEFTPPSSPGLNVIDLAKRFESTMINKVFEASGLDFAWSWQQFQDGAPAFLICWSYWARHFVARGVVRKVDGDAGDHFVFAFSHGFHTAMLMDEIIAILERTASASSVAEVSSFRCPVTWHIG